MSYATPGDYVASCSKSLSSCPACSGIVAVFSASSCMVSVFSALAHRLWSTYQGDASCFKTCSMYTHKDVLARLCFSSMGWECEFGLDRLLLILDSQKFLNNSIEPAHRLWSTYQGDASCFKTTPTRTCLQGSASVAWDGSASSGSIGCCSSLTARNSSTTPSNLQLHAHGPGQLPDAPAH